METFKSNPAIQNLTFNFLASLINGNRRIPRSFIGFLVYPDF